ncbi:MAG: lipoprotein [Pseudomonas sp.]|nr:lipoprotein [Pseudomonas sp.]
MHKTVIALLIVVLTTVCGCTRVGLAYRHLDVIIPWSLNDYLSMNSTQKEWLDERLKENLSWHCTTQLPGYLAWLDRLQHMVESNQVTEPELKARTTEARQAIEQITKQITPSAVDLLRQLDDKQVQTLQEAFAKDLREHQDDYLKPPLNKQISDRAERMEKRLDPWIGSLTPAQHQLIGRWSAVLGGQNTLWIENRAHWQSLFIAAVKQRTASDFPQRIAQLLQERDSFWSPQYRQAYDQTEQAAIHLLVDLMAVSTPEQRQRLLKKIADVREDFNNLACLKAAQG